MLQFHWLDLLVWNSEKALCACGFIISYNIRVMGETNEDGDCLCPLCMEEMDLTDRHLRPCRCGYQLCVWCWHQIMELAAKDNTEGRCPACRTPYDKEKIVGAASSCEELIDLAADKKRPHKVKAKASEGRKHLSNIRVMQRNLVYVVGFPLNLADEENLEKREFFGQYGRILKVAMSRSSSHGGHQSHNGPSASVYVTYFREEDALRCIRAVDGCILEGKLLRACFGTNKYCNAWLKNMPCNNSDCLYLHEEGTEEDSFTKEEMLAKYGSKIQQFPELTHPPHRVVGVGLPAPLPEVPVIPQIHHQTSRAVGRPSVSSGSLGKATSLPAAASWGMRGKTAGTKTVTCTNMPKKRPAGSTCSSACSPSSLSNPSLVGVVLPSSCDESNKFVFTAGDRHHCSSSNNRTSKSDALHPVQNYTEGYDVEEQIASLLEPVQCSDPSIQLLNVGDVSISLCSSPPVDMTTVHSKILPKNDNIPISSVMEKTTDVIVKGSTILNSTTVVDKNETSEVTFLKALAYESPIGENNPPVVENNLLQVSKQTKARVKSPPHLTGDNSIISDILTMDLNVDGSFRNVVDLANLLRAGSSDPSTANNCNELPVCWKSQSSSQSRFSFARRKDHEQLNGTLQSSFPSSGDFYNQETNSQMQLLETLSSVVCAEDKMDVISTKSNPMGRNFDHAMCISTTVSSTLHEQISREGPIVHTTESTPTSASLMSITKARIDVPPGFSTPTKFSSVPPGFNPQDAAGKTACHGLIDQSQAEGSSSWIMSGPPSLAAAHVTDKQNTSDLELIDPAIMAVGRGNLPLNVGQIRPLDAPRVVPLFQESSLPHHSFMQGASGMNSDSFDFSSRQALSPHQSGMTDFDALLKHQQERANNYYSLPYRLDRHSNDQAVHSFSRLSSVLDGALPQRMVDHYQGNFASPISQNSAVHIGPSSFLNMTGSSTMGSLEQFGLGTSRQDSLNLETMLKNIYLSPSKQDHNGQHELDRRW